jgi:hypothetical protein
LAAQRGFKLIECPGYRSNVIGLIPDSDGRSMRRKREAPGKNGKREKANGTKCFQRHRETPIEKSIVSNLYATFYRILKNQ